LETLKDDGVTNLLTIETSAPPELQISHQFCVYQWCSSYKRIAPHSSIFSMGNTSPNFAKCIKTTLVH
jgi:hypothetical protein